MIATFSSHQETWTQASLGQFCGQRGQSIEPSKTPDSKFELYSVPSFPDGQPEIVLGKEVGSSKQVVESNSVLLCKINPRINRAWVVGNFSRYTKIASTEWIVFPPDERVMPKFLAYFLRQNSVRDFLASNVSGVGGSLMRVKPSTLRDFPFTYPDRETQCSIVAEIERQFSRLDEAVTSLKRTKANLKRYKAAVLKAAVEGKLTEAWRKQHPDVEPASKLLERILAERRAKWNGKGEYKEPEEADMTGFPSLPMDWKWARLEQLGTIFGGLTKNPKRARFIKKLPYLRVANVYANELRLNEIEHIGVQDSEMEKLLLQKGDLLLVEGNGSKDQIGRLAIWDGSISPCVHQNHLIKVRLVIASMNKWILFWLLSPIGRHFIEKVSSSTSGLYTLSINKVGDLPVIVPSLAEQEQIIAEVERRLSLIEELEATAEANLTRAERLRQSILSTAFSGRFPCGPNEGMS